MSSSCMLPCHMLGQVVLAGSFVLTLVTVKSNSRVKKLVPHQIVEAGKLIATVDAEKLVLARVLFSPVLLNILH